MTSAWLRVSASIVVGLCFVSVTLATPAVASVTAGPRPGHPVTFGELSTVGAPTEIAPLHGVIRFPQGARQGPDVWYTISLDVRATMPLEASGVAYLSASTNQETAAQLKFSKSSGAPADYSGVGLVNGTETKTADGELLSVHFENYLRDRGVVPGEVPLAISVELVNWSGPAPQFDVLASSAVAATDIAPYPLSLEVKDVEREGSKYVVGYVVRGTNGRIVRDVTVLARPGPGLVVIGGDRHDLGQGSAARSGQFVIRHTVEEPARLELAALSASNRPTVTVEIVTPSANSSTWSQFVGLAILALGAALLVRSLIQRLRS